MWFSNIDCYMFTRMYIMKNTFGSHLHPLTDVVDHVLKSALF